MGSRSREFAKYTKLPRVEEKSEEIRNDPVKRRKVNAHAKNGGEIQSSEKKTSGSSSQDSPAPDGGYGWFILLAAHCTLIFREGVAKCLGVFLPTFRSYFDVSTSLIGWISSLCVTCADFTGLISGPLCRRFGCRPIAMVGGFFAGVGLTLAAFTVEVSQLAICLSISGIGLGLSLTPSLTMVGHYFDKRYSLANGLSYAGSGVGILVLAPIAQVLIDIYTWRGGLMILGALCFHVSVCGALLRTLRVDQRSDRRRKDKIEYKSVEPKSNDCIDKRRYVSKEIIRDVGQEDDNDVENNRPLSPNDRFEDSRMKSSELIKLKHVEQSEPGDRCDDGACFLEDAEDPGYPVVTDSDEYANILETDDEDEDDTKSRADRCISFLGLSLFKDIFFVILVIVQFCGRFVYMGWLIYLIPHAEEKGIAPLEATFIASVAGVSNIVTRAGHGLIVDYKLLTAAQLLTIGSFVSAVPMLLDPVLNTYGSLMVGSLTYGAASGVFFPIAVVVIKQSIGMERFPNALGWSYGFAGVGRMSAGFITGWLFDHFGSYNQAFILLGLIQSFATILLFVLLFLSR